MQSKDKEFKNIKHTETMSINKFWEIIDQSLSVSDGDRKVQNIELQNLLKKLPLNEIIEFQNILNGYHNDTHTSSLIDASRIFGGFGDDEFEFFRYWTISQGRKVYEAAIDNPDSLAEILPTDSNIYWDEEFGYIAHNLWVEITGGDFLSFPYSNPDTLKPTNSQDLKRRFPKLWHRFQSRIEEDLNN